MCLRSCLACLWIITVGCGDDSGVPSDAAPEGDVAPDVRDENADADGGLTPVPLDALATGLERSVCDWEERCGRVPDRASCEEAFDPASGELPQLVAYANSGRLMYDPQSAAQCLDSIANAPCNVLAGPANALLSCPDVFTGSSDRGGLCTVSQECMVGESCQGRSCPFACCSGSCTPSPEPVGIGGDCTTAPCDAASYCHLVTATGDFRCESRIALGAPCADPDACVQGAVCSAMASGQARCIALVDEGESCDPTVGFPSGGCSDITTWCNPASSICEQRPSSGQPCTVDPIDNCLLYARCAAGTCAVRPSVGDACVPATPPSCLLNLDCVEGVCTVPPAVNPCP